MTLDELLVLKEQTPRPLKVVHCGSTTRAREAFEDYRLMDTLAGHIVLTIGANKNDSDLGITPEQAIELDILHLYKIDEADFVRVLNPGGYIGTSTAHEIEYAKRLGKPLTFLEASPYGEENETTQGEKAPLLSPCHHVPLYASRGDGVTIGSCSVCDKDVVRVNPHTGVQEWLDGHSPWSRNDLRPIEKGQS